MCVCVCKNTSKILKGKKLNRKTVSGYNSKVIFYHFNINTHLQRDCNDFKVNINIL